MVCFGLVRPEYLGPALEVVHFNWLDRPERNLLFPFDRQVHFPSFVQQISTPSLRLVWSESFVPFSSLVSDRSTSVMESYLINIALRAKMSKNLDIRSTSSRENKTTRFPQDQYFKCRLTYLSSFPGTFAGREVGKGERLQISSHWGYLSVPQRRLQGVLRVFRPQRSFLSSCGALSAC